MVVLMYKEDIELFIVKSNANHASEIETTFLERTDYNIRC